MRNKIFDDIPKSLKTSSGKWVYILPVSRKAYGLYDPVMERTLGRILFDAQDNWIYDGELLSVEEQEEVAGKITGHQAEMEALLRTLQDDND